MKTGVIIIFSYNDKVLVDNREFFFKRIGTDFWNRLAFSPFVVTTFQKFLFFYLFLFFCVISGWSLQRHVRNKYRKMRVEEGEKKMRERERKRADVHVPSNRRH